jgi:hypothetical protein
MEHSLGGKNPKKWHRNYFMASSGHTDLPDLRALEKHGKMKQVPSPSFCDYDSMLFLVTEAGKRFLAGSSCVPPTMDLYDADEYVITSDCLSNGKTRTDT